MTISEAAEQDWMDQLADEWLRTIPEGWKMVECDECGDQYLNDEPTDQHGTCELCTEKIDAYCDGEFDHRERVQEQSFGFV